MIPERTHIEFLIKLIFSGVSGESARTPQKIIVPSIIPAMVSPPDRATERLFIATYFFVLDLLIIYK
jgi:hypothetical protein